MSEDKLKRRRFLADLLFAGGAISGVALLAKVTRNGTQTPTEPQIAGKVAIPQTPAPPPPNSPTPIPSPSSCVHRFNRSSSPQVKGEAVAPVAVPRMRGDVEMMPTPRKP